MVKSIKNPRFRDIWTYQRPVGEVNSGEVLTVPDQSYTVRELLTRFTAGTMPPLHSNGEYEYDSSYDGNAYDALADHADTVRDPIDFVEHEQRLNDLKARDLARRNAMRNRSTVVEPVKSDAKHSDIVPSTVVPELVQE